MLFQRSVAESLPPLAAESATIANQRVSSDVLLSMIYPFDPAWRGLVHGPGLGMWTFPDDYPRRVGDAIPEATPPYVARRARSHVPGSLHYGT